DCVVQRLPVGLNDVGHHYIGPSRCRARRWGTNEQVVRDKIPYGQAARGGAARRGCIDLRRNVGAPPFADQRRGERSPAEIVRDKTVWSNTELLQPLRITRDVRLVVAD